MLRLLCYHMRIIIISHSGHHSPSLSLSLFSSRLFCLPIWSESLRQQSPSPCLPALTSEPSVTRGPPPFTVTTGRQKKSKTDPQMKEHSKVVVLPWRFTDRTKVVFVVYLSSVLESFTDTSLRATATVIASC